MVSVDTASLTRLHWIGIVLAAITGVLHFALGIVFVMNEVTPLSVGFVVAGIGFFVGIAAILTDTRRRELYILGIPFTAGQIVLWYVNNRPIGADDATGIADKIVQLAFIVVLVLLLQRE